MAGKTPRIHEYAHEGDIAGVSAELALGTPVDTRDPATNQTPLMVAVSSSKAGIKLVLLLIQHGADVNAAAIHPQSPTQQDISTMLNPPPGLLADNPLTELTKQFLEWQQQATTGDPHENIVKDNVLSLAANGGNIEKIQALLDAGADVRYTHPQGFDVLIDVMHGRPIACDPHLVSLVQLLIQRGAQMNSITDYSESALSVSSNNGRFDVVGVLLNAGADSAPLEWTALMQAIALGSLQDVEDQLADHPDLSARDFWSRTPWLLSLQTGDVQKAQLLLDAGASRSDRGRCGKTPLMYTIRNHHTQMLQWLLAQGFSPNDADEFGRAPILEAVELGDAEITRILLTAGAIFHGTPNDKPAIQDAATLEVVNLLVDAGADINDINDEMRASLTRLPGDGKIDASPAEYHVAKNPRFGRSNPELMNIPFWQSMIRSGAWAYAAREHFDDTGDQNGPIWCFKRFGKSINVLPDGRIIEIAGEHEDHYDPDFCIYNDVVVHHPDGSFDIYGYPRDCFRPTDFHTATQVGQCIYIIGCLGYPADRIVGETAVYRLDLTSYRIDNVPTTGEKPGWIHDHKATLIANTQIRITKGKIHVIQDDRPQLLDNGSEYILDLERFSLW